MEYPKKERILKLFGESCLINPGDKNEKEEASSYLNSWKKFLLRRLERDSYNVKIIDEQWGEIPSYHISTLAQKSALYLKIIIQFDWYYSDEDKLEGIIISEKDLKR